MTWCLITFLLACGSPAQSADPEPEPTPEPVAEAATVVVTVGTQCVEPAADEPADEAAVKARLEAAGITVTAIEPAPVCEACNTCPRMAFSVTTDATKEAAQAAVGGPAGPPPARVKVATGRTCQDPAEGAPADAEAMKAAIEAAGIEILAAEQMIVCQSCGCPTAAMMVDVASGDAIRLKELSKAWVPEREAEKGLKGSLP